MSEPHIPQDLQQGVRVVVETRYGPVRGGRTRNGAAVFLEVPYALPPERFTDPVPLPRGHRYEDKDYVHETKYSCQPSNHGQAAGTSWEDVNGLGEASEDPLFVNIVSPSSFTPDSKFPVKVYLHGGFLQFGSPHGLSIQAQHVAQARSEVWVNVGYRLSVFGFLACDEPKIDGNFGFKDQWLALHWVKDNIRAFGGDPDNIQLSGLSAGAHSVHQILHHISHLPDGEKSPIRSALLQSNAILTVPKTPAELRPQYEALCRILGLDPSSPNTLPTLRDRSAIPASKMLHYIETDAVGVEHGTYRGCLDGRWLPTNVDPMRWQRSGELGRKLAEKGLRSVVIGDLAEEWYLYAIAHPVSGPGSVVPNLMRYYPAPIVDRLSRAYVIPGAEVDDEEAARVMGVILSDGQVHLPVRLLARDLDRVGFPLVRYQIRWTPEQVRPNGLVTHGTDRVLWALRFPTLKGTQTRVALAWLDAIDEEVARVERTGVARPLRQALTLREDKTIGWEEDARWDQLLNIARVLPGEDEIKAKL